MEEVWRITLLGDLRAESGGRTITRFRTRKTAALLAYLALHPTQSPSREQLVEEFWPDDEPDAARASLRTALASLRRQLEPPGTPAGSVLHAEIAGLRLNPAAVSVDAVAFEAAVTAARGSSDSGERIAALTRAAARYGGDLMPGFYDDWVLRERERFSQQFHRVLRELAALLDRSGDRGAATVYARRAAAADPSDEAACRHLMDLLAAAGELDAALRQYQELEQFLRTELQETPSPAIRQRAEEIRRMGDGATGRRGGSESSAPPDSLALSPDRRIAPSALPTGTVTFLLTDIEGSTALWERAGTAFRQALASHHAVLRRVFHSHGGYEATEAGDSFVVAFAAAADALACSVAAQRALAAQVWPVGVEALKVRMALHTGDVEWEEHAGRGTYRGLALHHAARILDVAHGGQILCSEVTARLLRSGTEAPSGQGAGPRAALGVPLTDLGVYHLRDVGAPERLFQVNDPELPPRPFPSPRAEADARVSLPQPLTRFFGREPEMAHLGALLGVGRTRLVTLTGPGGSGKTRLAIEVARRAGDPFRSAIWFVALADVQDAGLLFQRIADALRIEGIPGEGPLAGIVRAVSSRPALLVLDNFEQLVEEGAAILLDLLQQAPALVCLVTSRHRLNLDGEQEFPVGPLPIPTNDERRTTNDEAAFLVVGRSSFVGNETSLQELLACPSVQLFLDRAQGVRPDFQVTPRNAAAVAALCEGLEGVPLALELAAARAAMLTPEQMLAQLSGRLDLLVNRRRDAPARHRTLRAALAWSVDALPAELRRFFALLSVFRGGWTVEAAERIASLPTNGERRTTDDERPTMNDSPGPLVVGRWSFVDMLTELRERSLIQVEERAGELRSRMLETMRQYAAELVAIEEEPALRRRHAAYYLDLAERASPLLHGPEQALWLERLEAEHDNCRAALAWCLTEPDARETGLRLADRLHFFWYVRGHLAEGRRWLAEFLAAIDPPEPTSDRAAALYGAARLAAAQGEFAQATALYEQSLAIFRALGDWLSVARALCQWGNVAEWMGDRTAARALYSQSLALCRELNDAGLLAHVLKCLGADATVRGDVDRAAALLGESLALYQESGNARGIAMVQGELARLALDRGEWDEAAVLMDEYLQRARELKDAGHTANALALLGRLARARGDHRAARASFAESLEFRRALGDRQETAHLLFWLAAAARAEADDEAASAFLAEARALEPYIRDGEILAACRDLEAEAIGDEPSALSRQLSAEQRSG